MSALNNREAYTIGHSTRTIDDFLSILDNWKIKAIADVRTIPRSRHNPQFNKETLPHILKSADIQYAHMPGLGGLRRTRPDSINTGWRNASFRGFADYMQTREFVKHLQPLIVISKTERTAIMCAEAVPWRCHRSLIADALTVRRFVVWHIMGAANCRPHVLTLWAKTNGVKIWYPDQPIEGPAI